MSSITADKLTRDEILLLNRLAQWISDKVSISELNRRISQIFKQNEANIESFRQRLCPSSSVEESQEIRHKISYFQHQNELLRQIQTQKLVERFLPEISYSLATQWLIDASYSFQQFFYFTSKQNVPHELTTLFQRIVLETIDYQFPLLENELFK